MRMRFSIAFDSIHIPSKTEKALHSQSPGARPTGS